MSDRLGFPYGPVRNDAEYIWGIWIRTLTFSMVLIIRAIDRYCRKDCNYDVIEDVVIEQVGTGPLH